MQERWKDLFGARFEILLYDLTSTYFEVDANGSVAESSGLKAFGYSRDKRPDCLQIVIALIITPDGLPIAYEIMRGNTSDKTTLRGMLERITRQYGKARRTWIMDRGIPTEEVLEEMRTEDPEVSYLVGTPKGRLTKLEKQLADKDWEQVKDDVTVKLLPQGDELYVLARSLPHRAKERTIRRKKLKTYWKRLGELQRRKFITREDLLQALSFFSRHGYLSVRHSGGKRLSPFFRRPFPGRATRGRKPSRGRRFHGKCRGSRPRREE